MGIGSAKPKTGRKDSLRLEEVIKIHEFKADDISNLRLLDGQIISLKRHWINIYGGKEKKKITVPRWCLKHNPLNEDEPLDKKCPYCDLTHGQDASARYEFFYLINAINREAQEDEPAKKAEPTSKEKKSGFKDITSKTWTPVEAVRVTSTVASRIQELKDLNKKKGKDGNTKKYDVDHPKFGCDIMIRYKPKAAGTDKYSTDKGDRTPLTDEEKSYLTWNLSPELLTMTGLLSEKEAEEDFKRMEIVGMEAEEEDEDDYELGDKKSSKKSKKSSKKDEDDEDDDDEDDDNDDDDDEEEEKPKKSKKSKDKSGKSSKKSKDKSKEKSSKSSKEKSSKSEKSGKKKKKKRNDDIPF